MGNQYFGLASTALANAWQDRLASRRVYRQAAERNDAELSKREIAPRRFHARSA